MSPPRIQIFRRCPICQRDIRVTFTHSQVAVTDLASSDRGHVANLSHPEPKWRGSGLNLLKYLLTTFHSVGQASQDTNEDLTR